MISDYERYHGIVLRELIVKAPASINIEKRDDIGRVNSFCLNGRTAIHIKHSSKRMPPWQFTFSLDNLGEMDRLESVAPSLWLALICGTDGIVVLSRQEFWLITSTKKDVTRFIRVDRDRRTMYRVFGSSGRIPALKPRGVSAVIEDAFSAEAIEV